MPEAHQWKKIGWGSTFTVEAKGMEVRPVIKETLDTITLFKAEILQLEAEQVAKRKELRELCN